MRKNKLFLTVLLLVNSAYADTKPVSFDVGDIAPRQKIKVNVNSPKWPGYHDIKCDIIDPSSAAIIRVSSDDSIPEIVEINQTKYNALPLQVSLKEQKNQLTLYKMYDQNNEVSNVVTFENLDDDVTISVKNCEISPNAILSKDLIYYPSTITCSAGTCKMQGGQSDDWNSFTAPDGTYTFTTANNSYNVLTGYYYNSDYSANISLVSKSNVKPYIDIYTYWYGPDSFLQCSINDVTKCPLINSN
jgi:hypothetical protein